MFFEMGDMLIPEIAVFIKVTVKTFPAAFIRSESY